MARVAINLPDSLPRDKAVSIGATIEAAVIIATVEEPWAVFKTLQ